ncbi:MAG: DUF411 domain-containing protein [Gallionella sp.]|nr:DUF411 domain-containing protein [Gallionella sp.]
MQTSKAVAKPSIFSKRNLLRGLMLSIALGTTAFAVAQQPAMPLASVLPVVDVYKSPQCGCCKLWAKHLEQAGFKVVLHDVSDVPATRKKLGMPEKFGSCHTATVGQYLVEGHVPASDIKRLLAEHPKATGLAVPGMVQGSPGMEGGKNESYDTLLVVADGTATVFNHHK